MIHSFVNCNNETVWQVKLFILCMTCFGHLIPLVNLTYLIRLAYLVCPFCLIRSWFNTPSLVNSNIMFRSVKLLTKYYFIWPVCWHSSCDMTVVSLCSYVFYCHVKLIWFTQSTWPDQPTWSSNSTSPDQPDQTIRFTHFIYLYFSLK